jgi:hypothetical protein
LLVVPVSLQQFACTNGHQGLTSQYALDAGSSLDSPGSDIIATTVGLSFVMLAA